MTTRKLKLDFYDGDGNKISVMITGPFRRNKVLQLLDFIDLIDRNSSMNDNTSLKDLSKFEKLQLVIQRKFSIGWFTSQELMIAYEDMLDEPIGLSTVSTYLYRLVKKRVLTRSGSLAERKYKLVRRIKVDKKSIVTP